MQKIKRIYLGRRVGSRINVLAFAHDAAENKEISKNQLKFLFRKQCTKVRKHFVIQRIRIYTEVKMSELRKLTIGRLRSVGNTSILMAFVIWYLYFKT